MQPQIAPHTNASVINDLLAKVRVPAQAHPLTFYSMPVKLQSQLSWLVC